MPKSTPLALQNDPVSGSNEADQLVRDLEAAIASAGKQRAPIRSFMIGLLEFARNHQSIPRHRGAWALQPLARMMGLHFYRANLPVGKLQIALLDEWGPRFDIHPTPDAAPKPRVKLPGVRGTGPTVPTAELVAAMRADAARMRPSMRLDLLNHLIHIAETTRTLPQYCGRPNMVIVRKNAGLVITRASGEEAAIEMRERWSGFFNLEEIQTISGAKVRRLYRPEAQAQKYLDHLAEQPDKRQYRYARHDDQRPSFAAAGDWTGMKPHALARGPAGALLRAHAKRFGLREKWPGPNVIDEAARQARRDELMPFVEECAELGIPLYTKPGLRYALDIDDLARRADRVSGLDLEGDLKFREMVKATGAEILPWTPRAFDEIDYDHMLEAAPAARSAHLEGGSKSGTKSRTKASIVTFRDYVARQKEYVPGANRIVGDDFMGTSAEFEQLLDQMQEEDACGGTPSTFLTAIRWVRTWLVGQRDDDGLGNVFSTALRIAISQQKRTTRAIADAVGMDRNALSRWSRGESHPKPETRHFVPLLEATLGLDEKRLEKLLDLNGSIGAAGKRKLPVRTRPHAPDNWRTMSDGEFAEFVEYVDAWLLHRSTAAGEASRESARRRVADEVRRQELGEELRTVGSQLQQELIELADHMTKEFGTTLLRRPGKAWEAKTTAIMRVNRLLDFAKWQIRPVEDGGLGRDPEHLTLADLLHPPLVFSYIDHKARALEDVVWMNKKRGKLFTTTESDFLILAATLTARDYGWVTQQPELATRIHGDQRMLPTFSFIDSRGSQIKDDEKKDAPVNGGAPIMADLAQLNSSEYLQKVRSAELRYRQAGADLDLIVEGVRDPMEPIQPIIDHPEPLLLLMTQLYAGGEREPAKRLEMQYHVHRRDTLINRLFALTALRSTNVREIRLDGPDPNLVWDPFKKQWLLKIHWRNFKNFRSAPLFGRTRHREWYRKFLPNENNLNELIDLYIKESRAWFLNQLPKGVAAPEHMFFTKGGKEMTPVQMWHTVFSFTGLHVAHNRYRKTGIPGCQPFGPHAYRDIRATDILLHPCEADAYLEAANALQTSPAMIAGHYGRVRSDVRNAVSDKRFLEVAERASAAARRAA